MLKIIRSNPHIRFSKEFRSFVHLWNVLSIQINCIPYIGYGNLYKLSNLYKKKRIIFLNHQPNTDPPSWSIGYELSWESNWLENMYDWHSLKWDEKKPLDTVIILSVCPFWNHKYNIIIFLLSLQFEWRVFFSLFTLDTLDWRLKMSIELYWIASEGLTLAWFHFDRRQFFFFTLNDQKGTNFELFTSIYFGIFPFIEF